jgi:hypothetical protein
VVIQFISFGISGDKYIIPMIAFISSDDGVKVGVNDFIIKAAAVALQVRFVN